MRQVIYDFVPVILGAALGYYMVSLVTITPHLN